jgi:hypothetical protein
VAGRHGIAFLQAGYRGGLYANTRYLLVLSYLPDVAGATRTAVYPYAGAPAGTVVIRSSDLRVHGDGTILAGDSALRAGELAGGPIHRTSAAICFSS